MIVMAPVRFVTYSIIPEVCCGCGLCEKVCPRDAVEAKPGKPCRIVREACDGCGLCADACKLRAISKKRGVFL